MRVLVDSSVWIDFFRRKNESNRLGFLLAEDLVVTNSLVLAEIVPALRLKKRKDVIRLLNILEAHEIKADWNEVIDIQMKFVSRFNYFVGISDILIFQNSIQNDLMLYSFDRDVIRLCELHNQKLLK